MNARATTTVSILRGSGTDEYGDPTDTDTVAYENIPASIIERSRRVFSTTSDRSSIVRYIAGRLPNGTDITTDDRIKDERDGSVYSINSLDCAQNPVLPSDIRLDLVKISSTRP